MEILRNIDAYGIQSYQQNRFPLLFIDRVDEVLPGSYAKGVKHFTYNEWFFPAHFSDEPNVPGFVQTEMLAQMFLMTFLTLPDCKGKKTAFIKIVSMEFKKKIEPGMEAKIFAELASFRRGVAKGKAHCEIEEEYACAGEFVIAVPDILYKYRPLSRYERKNKE